MHWSDCSLALSHLYQEFYLGPTRHFKTTRTCWFDGSRHTASCSAKPCHPSIIIHLLLYSKLRQDLGTNMYGAYHKNYAHGFVCGLLLNWHYVGLNSSGTRLFGQKFDQTDNKQKDIKARHYLPFVREILSVTGEFPHKWSVFRKVYLYAFTRSYRRVSEQLFSY